MRIFRLAAAASVAVLVSSVSVFGAVIDSDETCSLIDVSPTAGQCWGANAETGPLANDSEGLLNTNVFLKDGDDSLSVLGLFNKTDWVFAQKEDTPGGLTTTIDVGLDVSPDTGTTTGSWSVDLSKVSMFEDMLVILKAGNSFAAYLYTSPFAAGVESGSWNTTALTNSRGTPQGLSHLSIYVRGEVSAVPLPAAGWLLLAGVGGLAALRKRKAA